MLPDKNEWQIMDSFSGVLYPWYTNEAINYLETNIQYDKSNVLEFGGGHSTIWWALNAKYVRTIESDITFAQSLKDKVRELGIFADIFWNDDVTAYGNYVKLFSHLRNIIMVVDGEFRDECCNFALEHLPEGSIVICDNWMQPEVWMAGEHVRERMLSKKHKIFKQSGHATWQTAIFWI